MLHFYWNIRKHIVNRGVSQRDYLLNYVGMMLINFPFREKP